MITQSGCFGSQPTNNTIDNVEEVSSTVDGIIESMDGTQETVPGENTAALSLLTTHYLYMDKRVRLLTYAVVALSVVVLLKEIK